MRKKHTYFSVFLLFKMERDAKDKKLVFVLFVLFWACVLAQRKRNIENLIMLFKYVIFSRRRDITKVEGYFLFYFFFMWTTRSGPFLFDHLKSIFFSTQQC